MSEPILFRITLQTPPADTDYAIQKGSGNSYETIQKQRSIGKDLQFEFSIDTRQDKNNTPQLSGPIVQGKPGERFIYIDIGTYAGQRDSIWGRRLKIPLTGITAEMIKSASLDETIKIITKVPGIGKDGGPNCATVKPFEGWQLSH